MSLGNIVVVKKGFVLPAAFQKIVLADCKQGFSYSVANDPERGQGLVSRGFSMKGETEANLIKTLDEVNTKFKDKHLVLFFNREELDDDAMPQPYPILEDNGKVILYAYAEGDFAKYSQGQSPPEQEFISTYFADRVNALFVEQKENLGHLFTEMETEAFRKSLAEHLEPRGVVYLQSHVNKVLTLSKGNNIFGAFEWGIASNNLGYADPVKEEAKPLTWAEKQALKKAGGTPAATKPTEDPKSDKPEGGTEIVLDPKYGVLDGEKVRPPEHAKDRVLKDWYRDHATFACPQNYKDRPAIPFDKLKANSHILNIIKGIHKTPPKAGDKPAAAAAENTSTSSSILSADQVIKAVNLDKGATIIVDPAVFTAAETAYPSFCERTGIPVERMLCYSVETARKADPETLLSMWHEARMAVIKLMPEMVKAAPTTQTSDEKQEEKKPLTWAEKQALKKKTA
jgi:hypothetical protein